MVDGIETIIFRNFKYTFEKFMKYFNIFQKNYTDFKIMKQF